MNLLYEKYKNLKIDGSWIGLEAGTQTPYFCTPIGAEIIGWDNGIHYCFIKSFGDMVFCVNPETCCDYNVYPIARNFCDFLGLILATGNTRTGMESSARSGRCLEYNSQRDRYSTDRYPV